MAELDGKTALVTGGSRGIGRSIALALASEGADVALTYRANEDRARAVAGEIEALGRKAWTSGFDVADDAATDEALGALLKDVGAFDIVVNNAGVSRDNLLLRVKADELAQVLDTNLKGVLNVSRLVTRPMMKKRWGRIVNLTSVTGQTGNGGQSVYAASKAGGASR